VGAGAAAGGDPAGVVHTSGTVESQCAAAVPFSSTVLPCAKPSLPTDPV
jgi:hypothetical protein